MSYREGGMRAWLQSSAPGVCGQPFCPRPLLRPFAGAASPCGRATRTCPISTPGRSAAWTTRTPTTSRCGSRRPSSSTWVSVGQWFVSGAVTLGRSGRRWCHVVASLGAGTLHSSPWRSHHAKTRPNRASYLPCRRERLQRARVRQADRHLQHDCGVRQVCELSERWLQRCGRL